MSLILRATQLYFILMKHPNQFFLLFFNAFSWGLKYQLNERGPAKDQADFCFPDGHVFQIEGAEHGGFYIAVPLNFQITRVTKA
jgi:hypothetical protein